MNNLDWLIKVGIPKFKQALLTDYAERDRKYFKEKFKKDMDKITF